jgi:hypothetical protein
MRGRRTAGQPVFTRLECGDPGVSPGIYAAVPFVLGLADRFMDLADPAGLFCWT